jgi:hypothetical protein
MRAVILEILRQEGYYILLATINVFILIYVFSIYIANTQGPIESSTHGFLS